jgi:Fe2+ or Zn2+ uptake regulation protein
MKKHKNARDIEQTIILSLQDKGYKLTPQRREIIRLLSRDMSHPGAMEILRKIRKIVPGINKSTVYYTLDMMKPASMRFEYYGICSNCAE